MPSRHLRPSSGWVEVVCGSMFSGKTEELLRRVRRAVIARQNVQLFKPAVDTRYGVATVASHDGLRWEATVVADSAGLLAALEPDTTVVAVDEVQFFDEGIVAVCNDLAHRGLRVIVAGLDTDFRGEPFGPLPALVAQSEEVTKLHAICMRCGGEASRTQRLIDGRPAFYEDPVVMIGAAESYEARCRACHEVPRERSEERGEKRTAGER